MELGWNKFTGVLGGVLLDFHVRGHNLHYRANLGLPRNLVNSTILWLHNGDLDSFFNHGGLVSLLIGASVNTNSREWSIGLNLTEDNAILFLIARVLL